MQIKSMSYLFVSIKRCKVSIILTVSDSSPLKTYYEENAFQVDFIIINTVEYVSWCHSVSE